MSRCFACLALLLLGVTTVAAAPPLAQPTVTICWHGQSFFEITSTKGTRIVLDPHAIEAYPRVSVTADLLLMTHFHDDHTQVGVVENNKKCKQLNALKKVDMKEEWNKVDETFKDVKIRTVGTYHDDMSGQKRGKNGIWILEIDGLKIVHLGDLGHILTDDQVKKIGEVDVLLIPVGGVYTLNGVDAQRVVEQLKPRHYVVPMHYGTKVYDDLLPLTSFIEDVAEKQIKRAISNELTIDPAEKAKEQPIFVILNYEKRGK